MIAIVWYNNSAPLEHQRFKGLVMQEENKFTYPFPYIRSMMINTSKKYQKEWAEDVVEHLKDWNINDAQIIEVKD